MLDTMTATKIVGAFCGALLVYLMVVWMGEILFHTGGGHGDDHAQAYVIDTGADDGGMSEVAEEEGPDFAEMLASADAGKGEKVFSKCKACHKLEDGANGTGPHLYAVVDRGIGDVSGLDIRTCLGASDDVWSPENLDGFLENPKGWAPGTKMAFAGLKKPEDRANIVAYLQTIGN